MQLQVFLTFTTCLPTFCLHPFSLHTHIITILSKICNYRFYRFTKGKLLRHPQGALYPPVDAISCMPVFPSHPHYNRGWEVCQDQVLSGFVIFCTNLSYSLSYSSTVCVLRNTSSLSVGAPCILRYSETNSKEEL